MIQCHNFNISGPSAAFQINFDDVFFSVVPAPPPANGLCSVDTACSAGGQASARDSGSGLCVPVATCSELWKCALGPSMRSCGGGFGDCAFSPDCGAAVSDCFRGSCAVLTFCNDRVKYQGYAAAPSANQCSCAGNPPAGASACPACTADAHTLCLNNDRFKVQTVFDQGGEATDQGFAMPLTGDTGYFWFFGASNAEVFLKVLDGCALGGHYWVFAAGLTNVKVTLGVTDTATGMQRSYLNPANTEFQPIQDTSAFPCP
jgi:hypothetical protein